MGADGRGRGKVVMGGVRGGSSRREGRKVRLQMEHDSERDEREEGLS